MPEVASINQVVQIGVETTEGTAVPALKKLASLGFDIGPDVTIDVFKATGRKRPSIASMSMESAEGDLTGRPTYDEIMYPLAMIMGNMVTTSLGSGAFQHVFTPKTSGADVVTSLTIEQGDPFSGLAHRSAGVKLTSFGINVSRTATEVTGTVIGKRVESEDIRLSGNEVQQLAITGGPPTSGEADLTFSGQTTAGVAFDATASELQTALEALSNVNPGDVLCTGGPWPDDPILVEFAGQYAQTNVAAITATDDFDVGDVTITSPTAGTPPTELPETPIQATEWSCYIDDVSGSLGTTKATRVISVSTSDSDRFGPVWVVDQAQDSYVATVETDPTSEITVMLQANAYARALFSTMRAGASKFVRLEAVGPVIGGGINHRLRFDMHMKVTDISRFQDQDGVYAIQFTGQWFHNAAWAKSIQATVINTQATL